MSETTSLARLSMSLPGELFRQLDMMVEERGLPSRSQLISELIRHALAEHEAHTRPDEMLAGTITIVYRGDRGRVLRQAEVVVGRQVELGADGRTGVQGSAQPGRTPLLLDLVEPGQRGKTDASQPDHPLNDEVPLERCSG